VRGSSETSSDDLGYGYTIYSLWNQINTDRPGLINDWSVALDYPAIAIEPLDPTYLTADYAASVADGVVQLTQLVTNAGLQCSNFRFILAGYSQGAQVVGNAFADLPASVQKHTWVVMFGDPRWNHSQKPPKVNQGSQDPYDGVYKYAVSSPEPPRTISGSNAGNGTDEAEDQPG
jgi:hypothetical protein